MCCLSWRDFTAAPSRLTAKAGPEMDLIACGLLADAAGIIAAIIVTLLFFG